MNIVSLTSYRELPLLPGFATNQSDDPVAALLVDFQSWLSDRNYPLSQMSNRDIFLRLYRLRGEKHNPFYSESAYQILLEKKQQQSINQNIMKTSTSIDPLYPIGMGEPEPKKQKSELLSQQAEAPMLNHLQHNREAVK